MSNRPLIWSNPNFGVDFSHFHLYRIEATLQATKKVAPRIKIALRINIESFAIPFLSTPPTITHNIFCEHRNRRLPVIICNVATGPGLLASMSLRAP